MSFYLVIAGAMTNTLNYVYIYNYIYIYIYNLRILVGWYNRV